MRGFFHGASSPLIGGAIECGVNYAVYSSVLSRLHQGSAAPQPSLRDCSIAAATAGVALSFILAPVELVKCRLQLQRAYYKSPGRCLQITLAEEGWRGLTRGLPATLAREIPGNALFFVSYEVLVLLSVEATSVDAAITTLTMRPCD